MASVKGKFSSTQAGSSSQNWQGGSQGWQAKSRTHSQDPPSRGSRQQWNEKDKSSRRYDYNEGAPKKDEHHSHHREEHGQHGHSNRRHIPNDVNVGLSEAGLGENTQENVEKMKAMLSKALHKYQEIGERTLISADILKDQGPLIQVALDAKNPEDTLQVTDPNSFDKYGGTCKGGYKFNWKIIDPRKIC